MADRIIASFRGAKFYDVTAKLTGGRRTVIHEFPDNDEVGQDDLGLATERLPFEGIVIGPTWQADRDALIAALKTKGPGKLVHPDYGVKQVSLEGDFECVISTKEGGMARFTMKFVVVGAQPLPSAIPDTSAALSINRYTATAALADAAEDGFDVSGPGYLASAAIAKITALTAKISLIRARIAAPFGIVDDLDTAIDDLTDEAAALIRTPRTMAVRILALINTALAGIAAITNEIGLYTSRGDELENAARIGLLTSFLSSIGTFGDDFQDIDETTPQRTQQQSNQNYLRDLTQTAVLAETLATIATIPLESVTQADALQDAVDERFDALLGRSGSTLDDAVVGAIRDLRASFYEHLMASTADLSPVNTYTPQAEIPAIVLAYMAHGDASRVPEILRMNTQITNPLAIPPFESVQLLADV